MKESFSGLASSNSARWRSVMLVLLGWPTLAACSSSFDDLRPEGVCAHAEPPPVPALGGDPIAAFEFVGAVHEYDLGEKDVDGATERFRTMGYDLDRTCTGQGQGPSCAPTRWATEPPRPDNPEGRDNTYGGVVRTVLTDFQTSGTDAVNTGARNGNLSAVIRVRGYNGTSIDNQVEVAIFGATLNDLGANSNRPKWDGTDVWVAGWPWWVEKDDPNLEHPKSVDTHAYVNDSILVARIDLLEVPGELQLSQVVLTARIVDDGGWSLADGTIAGRLRTDNVLAGLHTTLDPADGKPFCTNSPSYASRKQSICANSDISFEGPGDPSIPCDAMSWGWKFIKTVPAILSGTTTAVPPKLCPPETLPENDSCDFD